MTVVRVGIFLVVLVLDQLTKYLALSYLTLGQPIEVVQGLFNLTLVFNPGAAFGLFSGLPDVQRRVALVLVSLLAIGIVLRFLVKDAKEDGILQCGLLMVLGGAVGNIIDRFRFDSVVDFLDFYLGNWHWPAFNVADSAICVGVSLLMFRSLFGAVANAKQGDVTGCCSCCGKSSAEQVDKGNVELSNGA